MTDNGVHDFIYLNCDRRIQPWLRKTRFLPGISPVTITQCLHYSQWRKSFFAKPKSSVIKTLTESLFGLLIYMFQAMKEQRHILIIIGALQTQTTLTSLDAVSGMAVHTWMLRVHNFINGSEWLISPGKGWSLSFLKARCAHLWDKCKAPPARSQHIVCLWQSSLHNEEHVKRGLLSSNEIFGPFISTTANVGVGHIHFAFSAQASIPIHCYLVLWCYTWGKETFLLQPPVRVGESELYFTSLFPPKYVKRRVITSTPGEIYSPHSGRQLW